MPVIPSRPFKLHLACSSHDVFWRRLMLLTAFSSSCCIHPEGVQLDSEGQDEHRESFPGNPPPSLSNPNGVALYKFVTVQPFQGWGRWGDVSRVARPVLMRKDIGGKPAALPLAVESNPFGVDPNASLKPLSKIGQINLDALPRMAGLLKLLRIGIFTKPYCGSSKPPAS